MYYKTHHFKHLVGKFLKIYTDLYKVQLKTFPLVPSSIGPVCYQALFLPWPTTGHAFCVCTFDFFKISTWMESCDMAFLHDRFHVTQCFVCTRS